VSPVNYDRRGRWLYYRDKSKGYQRPKGLRNVRKHRGTMYERVWMEVSRRKKRRRRKGRRRGGTV
jgi:hypothetical protein